MTGGSIPRVLVAIAHHGTKNRPFLDRMLESFRAMSFDVDVVLLIEAPKEVPADVEVRVGLPSEDPWSLPFAHRSLFDERREDYDLFVYSEDDTLIEERHLRAVLELTPRLPEGHVLGAMRYEVDPDGARSYCSIHSHYRWDPASVFQKDGLHFARFTNDHAAWYAITRDVLHEAIASGGFLVPPHSGRYDMLVSAATDIFTRCGLERVLCLERLEDQLVHHLPNVYLGKLGIDEAVFRTQVDALEQVAGGRLSAEQLLCPETCTEAVWDRHTYHRVPGDVARLASGPSDKILSVGVGAGETEARLASLGHEVVTVPTDHVMAEVQRARGLRVLAPELEADNLQREAPYDRILLLDVLGYLPDPAAALRTLAEALAADGTIVVTVPDHARYELRNLVRSPGRKQLVPTSFAAHGIHRTSPRILRRWVRDAGLRIDSQHHRSAVRDEPFGRRDTLSGLRGNTVAAVITR